MVVASRRFTIFDGTGAYLHGGRWNSPGNRVIYASETYPGAVLEILVHTRIGRVPRTHGWIEIASPRTVTIEYLKPARLPEWDAPDSAGARRFGDDWVRERRSAILVVPSLAASGLARNLLINQDHPEFSRLNASSPQPWSGTAGGREKRLRLAEDHAGQKAGGRAEAPPHIQNLIMDFFASTFA
ncbi:MAG TPA: RES domain-containing protein [Bryobacteraceae bacterium]|nr:RES domain-containing protein [Bryobacteraceae bacterium]